MKPEDFDAVTFDVYGTLIDWEPGIRARLRAAIFGGEDAGPSDADLVDAFDRGRAHYQMLAPARPYPRILDLVMAYVAHDFGKTVSVTERASFANTVGEWLPFADAVAGLARLREHFVLGALTNMDDESFAASRAHLGDPFGVIVTAERAGAYKPHLRQFVLGLTDLAAQGIPPERVLHVAQSRRADLVPCNMLGQTVVHIDRPGRALGHTGFGAETAHCAARFESLEAFLAALFG